MFYFLFVASEKGDNPGVAASQTGSAAGADPELQQEVNMTFSSGNVDSMGEEDKSDPKESDLPEKYETKISDLKNVCPQWR